MDFDDLERAEEESDDRSAGVTLWTFLRAAGATDLQDLLDRETIRIHRFPLQLPSSFPSPLHLRCLQVTQCGLQRLPPKGLSQMCHLQILNLAENHLEHLPELITLTALKELNLAENRLQELPDLSGLENLRQLNVGQNCLTDMESFGCGLLELDASQNRLNTLGAFPPGSQLRTLWLGANQLTELHDVLRHCRCLVGLQLAQNLLQELPAELGQLTQLQHLDVAQNCLMTLPPMRELTRLRTLDLTGNRLLSLRDLPVLPELRSLSAADNAIQHLPLALDEFLSLETLNLVGNPVVAKMQFSQQHPAWLLLDLLRCVGSLQRCQLAGEEALQDLPHVLNGGSLRLQGRGLRALPRSLCLVATLQSMDLSNNQLQHLPEALGQLHLRKLIMTNNGLKALPESLGRMAQLEEMDASGNQLQQLPDLTAWGHGMVALRLAQNRLQKLPETFCGLVRLRHADLSQNRLVSLPRNWGQLQQLESLRMDHNDLIALPRSFRQLRRLKEVKLAGTPLASTLIQVEDAPEQRILWEMNQWGGLAVIEIYAQQPGKIPEALMKWRWATLPPEVPPREERSEGYDAKKEEPDILEMAEGIEAEEVVQVLRKRLDAAGAAPAVQQLMRRLFLEWHPDKRHEDQKLLATRVFQWLQEVKVHYLR